MTQKKKSRIFVYLSLWFLSTNFLVRSFLESKWKWEFTLFSFFPAQCADGAHFLSLHQSLASPRTSSRTTQPVEKKKGLLINPFYKAFQTEMGGFSISSREQYIGRCRAYLSTAQTGLLHLNSTTLLLAHFKTELIRMKRMIIFCMLFFCSSVVLTAASPRTVKYRQIKKKIEQLEAMVKDEVTDGICHSIEITFKHYVLLSTYLVRDITFRCPNFSNLDLFYFRMLNCCIHQKTLRWDCFNIFFIIISIWFCTGLFHWQMEDVFFSTCLTLYS